MNTRINCRQLRVLCIEDDTTHAERLRLALHALDDVDIHFDLRPDAHGVSETLARGEHDIVFLNDTNGSAAGRDVLRALRDGNCQLPVILVAPPGSGLRANELTHTGADECVTTDDFAPDRLSTVIVNALQSADQRLINLHLMGRMRELEALSASLAETNATIARDARIDALTNVFSRIAWTNIARDEHRCARNMPYGILLIDIDGLRQINNAEGHPAGDHCVARIATLISTECRTGDTIGRYDGEEFIVLLPNTDLATSRTIAENVLASVRQEAYPNGGSPDHAIVTVSIGVADRGGADDLLHVIAAAEGALRDAKSAGGDQVAFRSA
ncbi:MAG: diguanylate cyclase response regulator [Phycisphaerales bacterium]|nr:diguanylate cyclase response regulator [Phycisphaerales bacterium]